MGSSIHVWRLRYWRHCCLCLFSILISTHSLANPSGRYTYPGGNDLGSNSRFDNFNFGREATAARASGNLIEAHKDGSFTIYDKADASKTRPRSVPVKRTSNINPNNLGKAVGKKLAGGLGVSIVVGALWDEAMEGLDWVMGEGGQVQKKTPAITPPYDSSYRGSSGHNSASSLCSSLNGTQNVSSDWKVVSSGFAPTSVTSSQVVCEGFRAIFSPYHDGSSSPAVQGFSWSTSLPCHPLSQANGYDCVFPSGTADVSSIEIESSFVDFVSNKANVDMLTQLLKDACVGSLSPNRCFETLAEHSALSGPDFMKGPKTETSTRVTNPDGTISEAKTQTETNYNLSYQGDTITVKTETKTTNYKDGVQTGETVTEEKSDTEMNPEAKPQEQEEDKAVAVPCEGVLCEPPEYEQQFEELEQTKEGIIDDYHQTILNAPIFQAVGGFFDISANATCPVWQTNVDFSVFESSLKTDLVFDFHCRPEFSGYRPWALAVMLVVAGFAAFRIGVLD